MPNTIVLKGDLYEKAEEARAGGTIMPGMLLGQTTATTDPPTVVAHATAGGPASRRFAKEDVYNKGHTIDDAYASGDLVHIHHAQPGDEIYALLPAGASAVVKTDYLTSNGDGTLKKATSTDIRLAEPLQAVNNSGSSATARIKVRVL